MQSSMMSVAGYSGGRGHEPAAAVPDNGHWSGIAQQWRQVFSPLRPTEADLALCARKILSWARTHGAPRALILGVTPELYHLPWPDGSTVSAMDHTQAMIDALWPGPRDDAVCADWTDMPLPDESRDIVLCDGGLTLLRHPDGHHRLVSRLKKVVKLGGLCIFRLYVPPAQPESADVVLQDLLAGHVANLNVLKLRLAMALQASSGEGVQLRHIWDTLHAAAPDWGRLAQRIGWPMEHLAAIDTYKNCATRYYFPTIPEIRHIFLEEPGGFELCSLDWPSYELGERCPTMVLRRSDVPPLHTEA